MKTLKILFGAIVALVAILTVVYLLLPKTPAEFMEFDIRPAGAPSVSEQRIRSFRATCLEVRIAWLQYRWPANRRL